MLCLALLRQADYFLLITFNQVFTLDYFHGEYSSIFIEIYWYLPRFYNKNIPPFDVSITEIITVWKRSLQPAIKKGEVEGIFS
jgi:hypothetical protein